jgi:hypothetical protein
MRAVALLVGVVISAWGVGTVSAQEHNDDHGGGETTTTMGHDDDHGGGGETTTTTAPGPTEPSDPDNWVGTPGQQTTEISYGPFNIPALQAGQDHASTGNQFRFGIQKPCNNCYITGIQASLSNTDGSPANPSTGSMLHHMVLANTDWDKTDATCEVGLPFPLGLMFGDRFFASGDERTLIGFPPGYGYRVGTGGWNLIYELASMVEQQKSVNIDMTYTWVPATTPMSEIRPVWMDVAQCGFSTYNVPAGPTTNQWSWTANAAGGVVAIGGHQHRGGVNIETINETTGETLWDSVANYGETPEYIGHHGAEISSMTSYIAPSGAENRGMVSVGDRVTIRSHYNAEQPETGVMGIVMMFLAEPGAGGGGGGTPTTQPGGGGGGSGACETATNSAHVQAGRATSWLIFAWAEGSNNYLGSTFATTSLREDPAGTWSMVDSC